MKYIFTVLAAITLLVSGAVAQNGPFAPYVLGTISTAPGSSNENYSVGVGLESSTKHLLLDANGMFNTASVANGAGHAGTLQAQGYYKLFSHILLGGGANWAINTSTFNAKNFVNTARTSASPFVGGGVLLGRLRSILTYQIPSNSDPLPGQRAFNINSELGLTEHLRVVVPIAINSYDTTNRVTVTQVGAGLKFVF